MFVQNCIEVSAAVYESSWASSSSSSLYSPIEHSVTNSELGSRAGQHGSKKATLTVAREERIKYT